MPGRDEKSDPPDEVWHPGTGEDIPTYRLPVRSKPYLVKINSKYVRVQALATGTLPEPDLDVALGAAMIVPPAEAKPRGRQ